MSPRRLRFAPVLLAAVAAMALGWGAAAAGGWHALDLGRHGELVTALRLEAPVAASGVDERLDARAERLAKPRWIPLAVAGAAALLAGADAVRRRHRHGGDITGRARQNWSPSLGRAPPHLLRTAN